MQAIELKKGMIFDDGGKLMLVMVANHHKPGKGNTVMQMDLRDVRAGSVIHKTMRPSEKIELVEVVKKNAQYLYAEGDSYNFMDTETYEQYAISGDQLGDDVKYLMPNIEVILEFTEDGELLAVQLPSTVNMKVVETQPGIKGATAASGGKPATMETGLVVTVPDFINEGDELVINTLEGTYKGRA
ncbi:MAG: elongation factor P [Lactobacillus delbrueckii]|jgi:elongation factor P|uniref:elongation factor P n=1 Tax=Lactobacillus delbrueckii TaxID=1584 RepID=UPI00254C22FC|nr:elongation factor P [Lactobacillus delbrueckii]MCI1659008.1 elongation factor P [Lactobacillus delbrueckii]MCI1706966.1 elongation factor P [Lactobacillus delbrueckii]MCI1790037.1 elongation factor P [Lactobacillus delbrueckii]MDK8261498.1 elongation factor P [Lactobacillus delbrueckii]